jgi:hypothetical protein
VLPDCGYPTKIGIALAVLHSGGDAPISAPDLNAAVRLAKRYGLFNHRAPSVDVLQRHRAWIAVAEHWLDATPHTPPILTGARLFAFRPCFGLPETSEGFAKRPRRVDG